MARLSLRTSGWIVGAVDFVGGAGITGLRGARVAALVVLFGFTSIGPAVAEPLAEIVYGGDQSFPPYEFLDDAGLPAGLNVDLIRAIAANRGMKVRFVMGPWVEIREGMRQGDIDVVAMYRAPARMGEVDFSIPHEFIHHEVFVRPGHPPVRSLADLAGQRVVVEAKTMAADALEEMGFGPDLVPVGSEPAALERLADGDGDAAIVTQISGRPFQYRQTFEGRVAPTGPPVLLTEYAFVVRKGRRQLLEALGDGLLEVKSRGEYDKIYARWVRPESGAQRWLRFLLVSLAAVGVLSLVILAWNRSLRRRVHGQTEALRTEYAERARTQSALVETERSLQAARKLEAVGSLASGVAHDFNNILTVILGAAGFLREDLTERGEPTEEVDSVIAAAERAGRLTRQLLAFSRSTPADFAPIDVCAVVQETESMLRRLVGERIIIETALPMTPIIVGAGVSQLEQVLMNLCVNARDAMPQGGRIRIVVEAVVMSSGNARGLAPGDYVTLVVSDSGVGMDAATSAQIFQPLYTTKAPGQGTGLGLATVASIAKTVGGKVEVDSTLGQGSTFTVFLPRSAADKTPTLETLGPQLRGNQERILVVEDDDTLRRTTATALTRAGYRVVEARDGEHGLEQVETGPPLALVVTDVVMPRLSGPAFVARLRKTWPDQRVLYLSGYVDLGKELDLEASHSAFIAKPFTSAQLVDGVAKLLAAAPAPPEAPARATPPAHTR